MVLKIHQLLNNKPYEDILIKNSLSQYLSEDVAMHAGIPAAIDEYFRLKHDTSHFIVPGQDWMIMHGLRFATLGDYEDAILIFKAALSEYPGSWEAHNGLGEAYLQKGDRQAAIQSFKKALELNPENTVARQRLKELEK